MSEGETQIVLFEKYRKLLFGVAYRMLGSVSDAEDILQEAWLRWNRVELGETRNPKGWLITVVSRLCLDQMKAARVQREHYYGVWLPEPLVEEAEAGNPKVEKDESVSIALMLVLEKLTAEERLAFLLYEVFGYRFKEIAAILGRPEVNCRKWVSRPGFGYRRSGLDFRQKRRRMRPY